MRFSEVFNHELIRRGPHEVKKLSRIGAVTFGRGVSDKTEERTPHYEIASCMEMFERNPIVTSSMEQLLLFIFPNKRIKIGSKDPKTKHWLETWHSYRPQIRDEFSKIILTNLITANAPMEKLYANTTDGRPVLDNIAAFTNVARFWVNPDDRSGPEAFVIELPVGTKGPFLYRGRMFSPDFITVQYMENYNFVRKRIYGIKLPYSAFDVFMSGWSRDGIYGRSGLASAIDANNILMEILSSWDTIAKTRQIDLKILTVSDPETMMQVDAKDLKQIEMDLENAEKSFALLNIPLKFVQQDIKTSGNYDLMVECFDALRRLVMMSLLPQHLTPWADSATTQGSEAAMPPFLGRVKAKQNETIEFFNRAVLDELRKTYKFLAPDATYIYDEPKVRPDEYYIDFFGSLVDRGMMTKEKAMESLSRLGILDEDIVGAFGTSTTVLVPPAQGAGVDKPKQEPPQQQTSSQPIQQQMIQKGSGYVEGVQSNVTFDVWKKRMSAKYPQLNMQGWTAVQQFNIGGKDIRLVRADNLVKLFDGTVEKQSFDLDVVSLDVAKYALEEYRQKLIDEQDNFEQGESPEDNIIDELNAAVKKELENNLDDIFVMLQKRTRKTEDFTNPKVLGDVDDVFTGFSQRVDKLVTDALGKLSVLVIDDAADGVKPDKDTKSLLLQRRDLMKKNIASQIKNTKDKMLVDLKGTISRGIAAGRDSKDIKKDIEAQYNYEDGVGWKFDRIVRTDTRQAAAILKMKKYKEMGFSTYIWGTVGDEKVRDEHRQRNRRVFTIDDALAGKEIFPGGSLVPGKLNINCRCRMIPRD